MEIESLTIKIDLKVWIILVDLLARILLLFIIQGILATIIKIFNIWKCILTIQKLEVGLILLLLETMLAKIL